MRSPVHVCQYLEENPKASGDEIQQVLKEFTDAVIGANSDAAENVKPVSRRRTLGVMTTLCRHYAYDNAFYFVYSFSDQTPR